MENKSEFIAVFSVGDNGDSENGPMPYKDFVGAYKNIKEAAIALSKESYSVNTNHYGLPSGYIPEEISEATYNEIIAAELLADDYFPA